MNQYNLRPAGFLIRLLAFKIDFLLGLLQLSTGFYFVLTQSKTIADLVTNTLFYLTFVTLPLAFIGLFLYPWLVSKFGGAPGKLITGLQILDDKGLFLTYKRSFFRHTVGRTFAALLFGLGYFAIIKDPEKKGWHDKAVGSKVVVAKPLWPIALVTLLVLVGANYYLISSGINKFKSSNLDTQFINLFGEAYKGFNDTEEVLETDSVTFAKYYNEALALREKKDNQGVLNIEKQLLENAPTDEEKGAAYSLLAYAYYDLLNDAKAREYSVKSLELTPGDQYANSLIAYYEYYDGNYLTAEAYARKALDTAPNHTYAHFILGLILLEQGKEAQARVEIKKATELDPTNTEYQDTLDSLQ